MSSPRPATTKQELTENLLGNKDNHTLKALMHTFRRSLETKEVLKKYDGDSAVDALRTSCDIGTPGMLEDGPIVKIIRAGIAECITNDVIKSSANGTEQLKAYIEIISKHFHQTNNAADGATLSSAEVIQNAEKEVAALRKQYFDAKLENQEELKTEQTQAPAAQSTPPRSKPEPPRNYLTPQEQIDLAIRPTIINAALINGVADLKQPLVDVFTKEIADIIKKDIEECKKKGYIISKTQESLHAEQYIKAIKKDLGKIIKDNKHSPDHANIIITNFKQLVIDKKTELRSEAEAQHSDAKSAMIDNAKDLYKRKYKEIMTEHKSFVKTRCFLNSALRQQENSMIALGETKENILKFKLGLQKETLQELAQKSKESPTKEAPSKEKGEQPESRIHRR